MSTDNEQQAAAKLKQTAQQHDKGAVSAWHDVSRRGWELARHAMTIHDKGLFTYLGFETFDDWRVDRRIGRTTAFRYMRLYRELNTFLSARDIDRMTAENAELLLKVDEKHRTPALIEKAQTMKEPEFTKVIDKILQKATDAGEEVKELAVMFKIAMPLSKKEFIEQAMKDFGAKRGLEKESPSRILELLVAEWYAGEIKDSALVVAYLIPELRALVNLTKNQEHDPRWLMEQVVIKLERAMTAVMHPENLARGGAAGAA